MEKIKLCGILAVVLFVELASVGNAQSQQHDLAAAAQNPIGNMISMPFEYDGNYGVGTLDNAQSVVTFEPVAPVKLSEDVTLILRPIIPFVWKPKLFLGDTSEAGLGDIVLETFFTPAEAQQVPGGIFTWGIGPAIQFDTASDPSLGTGQNALGVDAVVFAAIKPFTFGALVTNMWGISNVPTGRTRVNAMTLEPFVNYNMDDGWYLTASPVMTANWSAPSGQQWTIPLGGGFGRIFKIGSQPVNAQVQAFGHVANPRGGAEWSSKASFTFLFPE
jgi:hypothetical protein